MDGITPELVVAVAVLVVVAAPIAWLFVSRYFRLKEKELELEAQRGATGPRCRVRRWTRASRRWRPRSPRWVVRCASSSRSTKRSRRRLNRKARPDGSRAVATSAPRIKGSGTVS